MSVSYKYICERLRSPAVTAEVVNKVKLYFRQDINSNRRLDKITTIDQLIKVLECRDCINEETIQPLRDIAIFLQRRNLIPLIDEYGQQMSNKTTQQHNKENRVPVNQNLSENNTGRVIPAISTNIQQRIYDIIATEIGNKWKNLGRALEVPEGKIDELELRYKTISEMTYEILKFHQENVPERYWKIRLCQALEKARRKDLCYKIQELFAEHHMM